MIFVHVFLEHNMSAAAVADGRLKFVNFKSSIWNRVTFLCLLSKDVKKKNGEMKSVL